jgi:hypothetical protein
MKRIIFIMLAAVAVPIAAFVLFIVPPPHANVTLRAVGPTGRSFGPLISSLSNAPQPIWRFTISNGGPAAVSFRADVHALGGYDRDFSVASGFITFPEGFLPAGKSVVTNMLAPGSTGAIWRGQADYFPYENNRRSKLRDWFMKVPGLGRFVHPPQMLLAAEPFHTNRNIAATSDAK